MTEDSIDPDWKTALETAPLTDVSVNDIDWSTLDADSPDNYDTLPTFLATQIRHIETTNLALYGQILHQIPYNREADQKMILRLSAYNTNRANIWTHYLERTPSDTTPIMPDLEQFYDTLFKEDDPLLTLLVLETLNMAGIALYRTLPDTGDAAFDQIITRVSMQKREEYGLVLPWLQDKLADRTPEEQQELIADLQYYIDHLEDMYHATHNHSDAFNAHRARNELQELMERIYSNAGLIDRSPHTSDS